MEHAPYRILHPTDLSEAGHPAFLHALKLALAMRGKLTILHVERGDEEVEWSDLPGVRGTLSRWGLLPAGAHHQDVATLGLAVRKVIATEGGPVKACLRHLESHPADLLVLATSQGHGRSRWSGSEVSGPLSRASGLPTIFVPFGAAGVVDPASGGLRLDRVLMPVAEEPSSAQALVALGRLLGALGASPTITLLHVGGRMPAVAPPDVPGVTWVPRLVEGDVVSSILAEATAADLVVMATDGRSGLMETLRGSHVEQVLRGVRGPLLAWPVKEA